MSIFYRASPAWAVLTACLTSSVLAQEPTSTVTGVVVDSSNQPINGVLVFMDAGPDSDTTGAVGAFRLEGIATGTHLLNIRKAGFAPRTFRLVFAPGEQGNRDVGGVMLEEGPDPTATLVGRVTSKIGGLPLASAVIEVNGVRVALTAADGAFHVPDLPVAWGSNQFEVHHLSFDDVADEFWIVNPNETLDVSAVLEVEPLELSGFVIEGTPTLNEIRMAPFYERQKKTAGRFITRSDIVARDPPTFTEMMRGISGVRVEFGGPYGNQIYFARSPGSRLQCPSPVVYLDGILIVATGEAVDFDALVSPEQIEGVELYSGASIPIEFNRSGSTCGVIAIWSR